MGIQCTFSITLYKLTVSTVLYTSDYLTMYISSLGSFLSFPMNSISCLKLAVQFL